MNKQQKPTCACMGRWSGSRCEVSPCTVFGCNSGTCVVTNQGIPACTCPDGCTGNTCDIEDNTSCQAAQGTCTASQDCASGNVLTAAPCCNGNVCCQSVQPCPVDQPGWALNGNSCYFFRGTADTTWDNAQIQCQSMGGRLAEIETVAENDFLKQQGQTFFGLQDYGLWIGATDRNLDGAFNWESDGSVVSTDVLEWDDRGGFPVGQECLVMYLLNANKKRDYACSVLQGYICERPA